jgi:phosphoserine aminotransferase
VSGRIYNFSAGPACLPEVVVKKVEQNLLNYNGTGLGVMELSHRSSHFAEIIQKAEQGFRTLLDISDDYTILFTTGGATQQFSMVPMNILQKGKTADYIITGSWAKKAAAEAKKFGEVNIAADGAESGYASIPTQLNLSTEPAYVHFTSNNTIAGTQFHSEPEVGGNVLVCDASSDLLHKKIDINKYGIIYAGAQKNLGPSGVTVVIMRKDLLDRAPDGLPTMLDYRIFHDKGSLYNTAPTFPIYVISEVLQWLSDLGGLDAIYEQNKQKAKVLYDALDQSSFYKAVVAKQDRSLMNIVFRLPSEDLEKSFVSQAAKQGFDGLKGHRSVGGARASIYNSFPPEGVAALVEFMKEFEKANS